MQETGLCILLELSPFSVKFLLEAIQNKSLTIQMESHSIL